MLLLKESDLEIKDKKGSENVVADHLSRLLSAFDIHEHKEKQPIIETFPHEHLFSLGHESWYANIVNYLACGMLQRKLMFKENKRCLFYCKNYFWNELYLFNLCQDQIIRQCVPENEHESIRIYC